MSVTKIHISRVAQVQSRAGGYAIEFFGVCFIVAIYLRWFKEEKCLNVRQKLGTRNVIENLRNLQIDPWDMLNNFCFLVYAQKSLFQNLQTCKLAN